MKDNKLVGSPLKRVLLVEDDLITQLIVKRHLQDLHEVVCVTTVEEAINELASQFIDVLILDYALPDGTALDVFDSVENLGRDKPVIILTKFVDTENMTNCWKRGAFDFIEKPIRKDQLVQIVNLALEFKPPYSLKSIAFDRKMKQVQLLSVFHSQELLQKLNNDVTLIDDVLRASRRELGEFKHRLLDHIDFSEAAARESLTLLLQRLEGLALSMCADELAKNVKSLQMATARGESLQPSDLVHLNELVMRLDHQIETFHKQFQSEALLRIE